MFLQIRQSLFNYWNFIFSHDNPLKLLALRHIVPLVLSDVADRHARVWIGIENQFYQFFTRFWDGPRDQVVAVQDFLVQFRCVRIFERQVATSHRVEDDPTGPDISI